MPTSDCADTPRWCELAGTLCLSACLWDGGVARNAAAGPRAVHAGCLQLQGWRISDRSSPQEKGSEVCAGRGTPTLLGNLFREDLCVVSALFLLSLGLFFIVPFFPWFPLHSPPSPPPPFFLKKRNLGWNPSPHSSGHHKEKHSLLTTMWCSRNSAAVTGLLNMSNLQGG